MEEVIQYVPNLYATFWALIPPLVAIILALITKEVYSSLFVGIVIGGLFYGNIFQSGFSFEKSVLHIFEDGLVGVLSDPYNVGILVFLVVLGIMVCMMNKAGGSAAFGEWAGRHIKTRVGAQLVTVLLGILIFIDDYFNCLTVGSVMRPVTDKHNVSRAKLAYLIDATAAPICIIAPISSWAAAVTGFVEGEDGFGIFIKAIPYNYYALFTIAAMILIVALKVDFGSMAVHEANAAKGDLYTTPDRPYANATEDVIKGRGRVLDLLFPIITLIVCCIIGMLYSGDFFKAEKAVLFSVVTPACKETLVKELVSTMHLTAPGSGIAVCLPLSSIGGKSAMNYLTSGDPSKAPEIDIEEDHTMKEAAYQLIVAIANQGYTDKVMEAARSAGARGGTIVHTRSTGAEDAGKFFGMSIAEEREMIFIVAPTGEKNAIMQAIMAQAGPSTKAQAITLSLALEDVVGLFTTNPDQ